MKSILLAVAALSAHAACLDVRADKITAADVAAAVPAFASLPADLVLSYAPQPGLMRVFPAAELMQRLHTHNTAGDVPSSLCFAWPMQDLSRDEVQKALRSELPETAEINVIEISNYHVPPGIVVFPLAGLQVRGGPPFRWKGHIAYAPGRHYDIWAQVDVRVPYSRVVAAEPIRAGDRITADRLKLETGSGPPQPQGIAATLEQAVGRTSKRLIPAGSSVLLAALESGRAISRGDAVQVRVISGSAYLRFDGIAQGRAGIGDLVPVRNPDTGRMIHARVEAAGRAVLELGSRE